MINSHQLRSYLIRIALFLFMKEICKLTAATEMYKVNYNFSAHHMKETIEARNEHPYNLLQNSNFSWSLVKLVYQWTKSLSYYRTKSLGYTPKHLQKYRWSRKIQKKKILKNGKLESCPCIIC